MLIIRQDQIEALDAYMLASFHRRLGEHLRTSHPAVLEGWDEARIHQLVLTLVDRAGGWKVTAERDVARLADLDLALGGDGFAREDLAWLRALLGDPSVPAEARVDAGYAEAAARHPETAAVIAAWTREAN